MALQSFLSPLNFKFELKKLPNFVQYVQKVDFPSVEAGRTPGMPNPFQTIDIPGEHMKFDELHVTFKVNDSMSDYLEIFNWIQGIGKPHDYSQYAALYNAPQGEGVEVDASLIILNSALEPNIRYDFINLYPYRLTGFELDTTLTEVEFVTATVSFTYMYYIPIII